MERRQFTRIILNSRVELLTTNHSWASQLLDLSLKGALIQSPEKFMGKINEAISLTINIRDLTIPIVFEGVITHIEDDHIGLRCDRMDIDSITELRRLIELNMGDDELLHRELHSLIVGEPS